MPACTSPFWTEEDIYTNDGVDYYTNDLRPHFVKGVEAVFTFRFYQLQRFYRGSQDLQRWIGRLQVLRKRIIDAWMGTFHPDPPEKGGLDSGTAEEEWYTGTTSR